MKGAVEGQGAGGRRETGSKTREENAIWGGWGATHPNFSVGIAFLFKKRLRADQDLHDVSPSDLHLKVLRRRQGGREGGSESRGRERGGKGDRGREGGEGNGNKIESRGRDVNHVSWVTPLPQFSTL